jgi:hypothetical protein
MRRADGDCDGPPLFAATHLDCVVMPNPSLKNPCEKNATDARINKRANDDSKPKSNGPKLSEDEKQK